LVRQDGPNTIAPGSVTISNTQVGTYAAVAWLEPNSTAVFSFRGSTSRQDWLADFQLWRALF
jgi:predicted lipase